jgi:voltage-gated potassium channel
MKRQQQVTEIKGNSFRNLLFLLMLYIVVGPFLIPYPSLAVIAHGILTFSLFLAIYTVQKKQSQRPYVMGVLAPLLVLYWLAMYDVVEFSLQGTYVLFLAYYGLLIYSYVLQIRQSTRVTKNVLFASFCLYLMIGLFWGALYGLLNTIQPGAYSGALLENADKGVIHVFNYFSLITLTTLGYGDITPQSPGAASICQVEAVIGQFFTAVLVAWLVSKYMMDNPSSSQVENEEAEKIS